MKKLLLIVLFTIFSGLVSAETRIETIQLNHRLASEVLPEIQAFLPKQATARAFNDFIILQADNKTITQIKQLINKLDTPLQRLKISVMRTDQLLTNQDGRHISGHVSVRDGDIDAGISASKWSTKGSRNKDQYFQAQGIANTPITIMMGSDTPQREQYLILSSNGDFAVQNITHYVNINNGFKAVARVLPNNQVAVDVHPLFGHFSQQTGIVETSNIVSSISGEEGVWILLGETSSGQNIERSGVTSYSTNQQQQQNVYIKVEQLF